MTSAGNFQYALYAGPMEHPRLAASATSSTT